MKYFLTTAFLFFIWAINAQNLVPNPGFDNISQCPYDYGQIDLAPPWESASNGTPDLYNECTSDLELKVPDAGHYIDSYQKQRSGQGYAEIVVYFNANIAGGEYIETPLLAALISGKNYYIEFYVSPDLGQSSFLDYSDAVGLALTKTKYYKDLKPHEALPLTPVIENRGTLIRDTVGWTKISGCYTALGGEKFAIIGNFRNEYETMIELEDPGVYPVLIFFYIEDVLISVYDPFPDTLMICKNENLELNGGFLDATYRWNTGESDSTIIVQTEGQYIIQAFMDNCVLSDTVVVISGDETISATMDTTICHDEVLKLSAPLYGDYLWTTGSKQKEITIQSAGQYDVTVTNDCGEFVFLHQVGSIECDCDVFIPNVLSLNNDGINDVFRVSFNCDYPHSLILFSIFDRWGGRVYSTKTDDEINLNTIFNSKSLSSGVYVWLLEYEIVRNHHLERKQRTGNITILR